MEASTVIVVQTKDRDILHSLAVQLMCRRASVTKYWSGDGTGIPQVHISVGDEVYVVPVAIYGYLINTEGVNLPAYGQIPDGGILPREYRLLQLTQNKNYRTVDYLGL